MSDGLLALRLAGISRDYRPPLGAVRSGHWQHGWVPIDQAAVKEKYHGHPPAGAVPFHKIPRAGSLPEGSGLKQRSMHPHTVQPGDKVFTHGEWVDVTGHPEDTTDRFGQPLKRIKARRGNGKEGYLLYGQNAAHVLVRRPRAAFRKPRRQLAA